MLSWSQSAIRGLDIECLLITHFRCVMGKGQEGRAMQIIGGEARI